MFVSSCLVFLAVLVKSNNDFKNNIVTEIKNLEDLNTELDDLVYLKEERINEIEKVIKEKDASINSLSIRNESLESIIDENNEDIVKLTETISEIKLEKIPRGYYNVAQDNYTDSFDGLMDFLTYGFELPTSYLLNVFDCSESAAYLEWALEKEGFDASICVGKTPWKEDGYHAWIMVYTADNYRTVIEATALTSGYQKWFDQISNIFTGEGRGIVYYDENDKASLNYYDNYDNIYETIYDDEIVNNLSEWNWWNGIWGMD